MKLKRIFNLVFITGLIIGISAAVAQLFFQLYPPVAYGVCMLGHPRDLIVWLTNNLFETDWPLFDIFVKFPALTVIGVFMGSFIAANRNKELKLRSGPVRNKLFAFIFGFLVINFGLLWGSCPIRTGLLVSYGNIMAIVALASIVIGVLLAIIFIKVRVRKETPR